MRPFNLQVPWELKAKTLELEGSSQDFLNSEAIKSQLTATGLWPPLRFETVCGGGGALSWPSAFRLAATRRACLGGGPVFAQSTRAESKTRRGRWKGGCRGQSARTVAPQACCVPSAGDLHLHRQGHAGFRMFQHGGTLIQPGIWPSGSRRRCSKLGTCVQTWKTWT